MERNQWRGNTSDGGDKPSSGLTTEVDSAIRWLMGDARGRRAYRFLMGTIRSDGEAAGSGSLMLARKDALTEAVRRVESHVKAISFDLHQQSEAEAWHESCAQAEKR